MLKIAACSVLIAAATFSAGPAHAAFQTIDVSSYVNGNVAFNPGTFPTGLSTGNQGTMIPFDVSSYNGAAGTWLAPSTNGSTLDVHVSFSGAQSFYALLNNYYGTPGADEYDITIKASNGDQVTYQSIGGKDTRDYNAAFYSNTIANSTTPWFDNGIGQRLDVRMFTLPGTFAADTITDFIITERNAPDIALFSGLTLSTTTGGFGVPEPSSLALFGVSLLGLGFLRRRRA